MNSEMRNLMDELFHQFHVIDVCVDEGLAGTLDPIAALISIKKCLHGSESITKEQRIYALEKIDRLMKTLE